ncbi:hypothetical protein GEV43_16480 [Actinomadura sp. J1-007]|uniref:STAS domain-containing protein n=1 Tax=Actinomadura sp. J1-007 TaxID=2661913 RepID=UPI0013212B33|nr:hypothetical protein [Actinomadura sp. J1-007]MWK35471.1 hypothetical protein [Actinomadura sp. J1-007]
MYAHSAGRRPAPGPGSQRSGAPARPGRPSLETRSRAHGPATVLALAGDLVADTVVTAEARILTTVVLSPRPLRLVLDLSGVGAVDSQGPPCWPRPVSPYAPLAAPCTWSRPTAVRPAGS